MSTYGSQYDEVWRYNTPHTMEQVRKIVDNVLSIPKDIKFEEEKISENQLKIAIEILKRNWHG